MKEGDGSLMQPKQETVAMDHGDRDGSKTDLATVRRTIFL